MNRIKLADVKNIKEKKVHLVELKFDTIGVYKVDGNYYAFLDNCPHADMPMGDCFDGGQLVCPVHGACFDAKTGAVISEPADSPLRMFDVIEEDDSLFIEYDEE